jgi:hypothetical protein
MNFDDYLKYAAQDRGSNPFMYRPDQMAQVLGYQGQAQQYLGQGGSPSESTGQGTEAMYGLSPEFETFLRQYDYTPGMQGKNADVDIRDAAGNLKSENFRTGDHTGTAMKIAGKVIPSLAMAGFGAGALGAMGYGPMAGANAAGSGGGIGAITGVEALPALTQASVNSAALGASGNLLGSYGAGLAGGAGALGLEGATYALPGAEGGFGVANTGAAGGYGGIGPATGVDSLSALTQGGVNSAALGPSGSLPGLSGGGIPWGQLAKTAGGQLLSAGTQMYGANQAAGAQRDATNAANALNAPAVAARNSALAQMQALLKDPSTLTSQPGYQFGLNEGTKALNSGAAARGMTYSGGQGKALTRYGQDYAGTKLDQSFNRLSVLAQGGQPGATQTNDNITNQGNANAMPWIVGANAVADGINGLTAYGARKNWWGG